MRVSLEGLPDGARYTVRHHRVDEAHSNLAARWADLGGGVAGVTGAHGRGDGHEALEEFVVDRALHVQAAPRQAAVIILRMLEDEREDAEIDEIRLVDAGEGLGDLDPNAEIAGREGRVLAPYLTSGLEGFNIDEEDDWERAEMLLARGEATLPQVDREPYPGLTDSIGR